MADGTRLKELQEAQKRSDLMFLDERAKREASLDELHGRMDQMLEVQEGLQASMLNLEHNMASLQQQLQSMADQMQQYNRNKSILGEGKHTTETGLDKEEDVSVSLHAMKGDFHYRTLRLKGIVEDKEILILIDSGSTHCFLDDKVASLLGCKLEKTHPMMVRVADGSKLTSQLACHRFSWEIQGHQFTHPVKVIKLGGYDLVLGCDWLGLYNPIKFDFHKGRVTLSQDSNKLILKALSGQVGSKAVTTHSLSKLMRGRCPEVQGELLLNHSTTTEAAGNDRVQELLQEFEDIFSKPYSLPPEREIEHRIELLPEAIPRKQHPYRYAYGQKTKIEKIVREMLDSGIIRPSQSSFASPVLLVKKKDGG
ncbi:UNVERIFIED_CONTAM: hypothetical protein Sindi_2866000 [Sesamum indicum]